jgi:hypothetical protein
MHASITYELVKTRMEQDRQAERRRLAQAKMPRVVRSSAEKSQRKRWWDAIPLTGRSRHRPAPAATVRELHEHRTGEHR